MIQWLVNSSKTQSLAPEIKWMVIIPSMFNFSSSLHITMYSQTYIKMPFKISRKCVRGRLRQVVS